MVKISTPEPQALSIGELARRSGTTTAILRSWEARHGFPRPVRQAGGHRRYREEAVAEVVEIVRLRRAGLSVEAAIAAATGPAAGPPGSFFAALRAGNPGLRPQVLSKTVLGALTWAMEDEYCARAERPVLMAAFQRAAFYRQSAPRWEELARTARQAVVFADFDRLGRSAGRPIEVPLAADGASRREWALVCDAPGYAACVAGWEIPGGGGSSGADRLFETVWTLDPLGVRTAARVGAGLLAEVSPSLGDALIASLAEVPPPASADLQQATDLFARVLSYGQRALTDPDRSRSAADQSQ